MIRSDRSPDAVRARPTTAEGAPCAACVFAVGLLAVIATASSTGVADVAPASVRELAPGHFVHEGEQAEMEATRDGDIANAGFVVGARSVAVIDPGGSVALGRALRAALRRVTPLPVSHVILTHFHPDHVFGASAFVEGHGGEGDGPPDGAPVEIVAHANHARAIVQRGAFYAERFASYLDGRGVAALLAPTRAVTAGTAIEVDLGGRTLTLEAWPTGHTDNDLSVLDADAGVLWAGDLLFAGRTPSLDGSLPGWLAVMDALGEKAPAIVVPGHGAPGSFESIAAPQRRYLESLLGGTREALANGTRLAEAIARAERAPPGSWLLFERQHPTNVTRAWSELEWE